MSKQVVWGKDSLQPKLEWNISECALCTIPLNLPNAMD